MAWGKRKRTKRYKRRKPYGEYLADKLSRARKPSTKRKWKAKIAKAVG